VSPHDLITNWLKSRGFGYTRETPTHVLYRKGKVTLSVRKSQKLGTDEAISIAAQSREDPRAVNEICDHLRRSKI